MNKFEKDFVINKMYVVELYFDDINNYHTENNTLLTKIKNINSDDDKEISLKIYQITYESIKKNYKDKKIIRGLIYKSKYNWYYLCESKDVFSF